MPYPPQFPYDLLEASPDDNDKTLMQRWMKASRGKPRNQANDLRRAYDELRDPRTRLGYDILLITGIAKPTDVSALAEDFARPQFLSGEVQPPALRLSLTDLGGATEAFYQPVEHQPMEIDELGQFTAPPGDLLRITFDR